MGCKNRMDRKKKTKNIWAESKSPNKLVRELILNASFWESKRGCKTVYQMLRYILDNSDWAF